MSHGKSAAEALLKQHLVQRGLRSVAAEMCGPGATSSNIHSKMRSLVRSRYNCLSPEQQRLYLAGFATEATLDMAGASQPRPRGEWADRGVRAYIRKKRKEWQPDDPHADSAEQEKKLRQLARVEYKSLTVGEQWDYALQANTAERCKASDGRFQWLDADEQAAALQPGQQVLLHSLVSATEKNGALGVCQEFLAESGRWVVKLADGSQHNLKPQNLRAHKITHDIPDAPEAPAPRRSWSSLSSSKARRARCRRVRWSLDLAAGGQQPQSFEVVSILDRVLSDEEKKAWNQHMHDDKDLSLAVVCEELIRLILEYARGYTVPVLMLCWALQECGWKALTEIDKKLGFALPKRTWDRSWHQKTPKEHAEKHDNGRRGYRRLPLDIFRRILNKNSTLTSRPYNGPAKFNRKRNREETVAGSSLETPSKQAKQIHAFTDTVTQIYESNQEICQVIKPSTVHTYMKRDFPEYRCVKRRLDCCMKCRQWDWQVLPACRVSLNSWEKELNHVWPGFMQGYRDEILPSFTAHAKKNMTNAVAHGYLAYVLGEYDRLSAAKPDGYASKELELREVVNRIKHEMLTDWLHLRKYKETKGMKVGMLDIIRMHELHFTLRDSSQEARKSAEENPEEDELYWQMDFLQHRTLPIGPDEGGDWWYAYARLQVTILVVMVWSKTMEPCFHVYCSHCLDQSPAFVVACLDDLFTKVGGHSYKSHTMFSDVGQHFRAAYTMGWWGKELLAKGSVEQSRWIFFPEGHGKGCHRWKPATNITPPPPPSATKTQVKTNKSIHTCKYVYCVRNM